jgi:hypothetical protein
MKERRSKTSLNSAGEWELVMGPCGGFEVPKIEMAFAFRNFKSENHTRFNKLLVWL